MQLGILKSKVTRENSWENTVEYKSQIGPSSLTQRLMGGGR